MDHDDQAQRQAQAEENKAVFINGVTRIVEKKGLFIKKD